MQTQDTAKDSVILKIKKLLALSESQNENEATLAASRAAELMDKFNITRSMVDFVTGQEEAVREGTIDDRSSHLLNYKGELCIAASYVTRCKVFFRRNVIHAIGTPSDLISCKEFYELLLERVEQTTEYVWKTTGQYQGAHGKSWKNSFRLGMVRAIKSRLYRESQESVRKLKEGLYLETPSENSTALMVVNNKLQRINDFVKANYKFTTRAAPSAKVYSAYEHGRAEGNKADLSHRRQQRLNA